MSDTGFLFALIGVTLLIIIAVVITVVSTVASTVAAIADDEDSLMEE